MVTIKQTQAMTLGELKSSRAQAKQRWKEHTRLCHQCKSAGKDTARYCDEGWAIVLDKRLYTIAIESRTITPDANQETLI